MVTVGKTSENRPICKLLKPQAYFATYNDAYAALLKYNKSPYDLSRLLTVNEVFERWIALHADDLADSGEGIKNAWKYCSSIYGMKISTVRVRHLKLCLEHAERDGVPATPSIKYHIKSTLNQLFDYALEYELVDRNYAREFNLSKEISKERAERHKSHIPFTDDEMAKIWECDLECRDMILIQCYTGWRPGELCELRKKNINLSDWTMTGGNKTAAGKGRVVPIHEKIRGLVKDAYDRCEGEYLFNTNYYNYRYHFKRLISKLELNPEHRTHDPRVHFVTMAKKYKVDEYVIKLLIGHSVNDLTENAYTKRDVEWLREEIEKIG
jgi:integrase